MYNDKPFLHKRQAAYKPGTLRTISLDITSRCNMQCPKCYAETFVGARPFDLAVFKRTADELRRMGVFHYVFQGGEPITDPARLEAIVKMIYPDETYINVVSNGWEMNRKRIRWLKDLSVDKIAFSLDSGIAEEHDAGRRQGSYARVMHAIDEVLAEGLLVSISIVVTHDSLYSDGFAKAHQFAKAKGIRMDVQIAEPVGKWDGEKSLLITPKDAAYIKKLQMSEPVLPNGQRMINRDIYCGECDHCPAGNEFMAIASNGDFLPCNFLQFTLGTIGERSVRSMRADLLKSRWFNGKHSVCLCGEDPRFIDDYIMPYVSRPKPLNAYSVFKLKGDAVYGEV